MRWISGKHRIHATLAPPYRINAIITRSDIIKDLGTTFSHRKVCYELKDVPRDVALPRGWDRFGLSLDIAPAYPGGWTSFSDEFPSTIALLNDCLLGTVVLLGAKIEMAYVFHDGDRFFYYVGGTPVEGNAAKTNKFRNLPARLQDFYREVHDGYAFFPAHSMGPQCLADQSRISDLIEEEDDSSAENWTTVLSNGGGDYVAVDSSRHTDTESLIWWHEDPANPEFGIDIFEVMDAWMMVFLENTKRREDFFSDLNNY